MTEQIRKDPPPAWWFDDRKAQFPHHLDLVGMAQEAGVGLLTGTDMAATIVPGASLHREMELHVEAGLSTTQALRSATANPAAAFGRDDLGTIEPGRIADMVLLRSNPIDNISNVREIDAVIARGRLFNREAIDGLLAEGRESAKLR